jgi:cardiolipin synthase
MERGPLDSPGIREAPFGYSSPWACPPRRASSVSLSSSPRLGKPEAGGLLEGEPASSRFVLQSEGLSQGNRIHLLRDGAQAYPRMLEAIEGAQHFILLEMYTFADDFIGQRFARALARRALAGVEVRVLYDALGSRASRREFFGWMRSQGIHVHAYNPIHRFLFGFRYRSRSHRKLLVVDGRTAFVGGLNLTREFASPAEGGGGWRDTELEIEGPAAADLARLTLDYGSLAGERLRRTAIRRSLGRDRVGSGCPVLALGSPRLSDRRLMGRHLQFAFRQARRRIWIANPYFLPGRALRRELRRARERGVDVRLLLPRASDVPPVQYASERMFDRYLRWGIRIFQWPGPMMHAKTAVIDGVWATVGSCNLDALSLLLNDELTAVVPEREFASRLEGMFEEDFQVSRELTRTHWRARGRMRRMAEKLFYLFRIIL